MGVPVPLSYATSRGEAAPFKQISEETGCEVIVGAGFTVTTKSTAAPSQVANFGTTV